MNRDTGPPSLETPGKCPLEWEAPRELSNSQDSVLPPVRQQQFRNAEKVLRTPRSLPEQPLKTLQARIFAQRTAIQEPPKVLELLGNVVRDVQINAQNGGHTSIFLEQIPI